MKTIYSSKFRIICSLFLTLAVLGVQDTNAQFWKKKKKEVKKAVPTKTLLQKRKENRLKI
ncbi:hypothetical protein [Polaribacter sp. Z022]|uniref:hypothetical protein n=1 Tax=Polaribacter sp. Z022 TaxID=2927125 RepID=UPI002020D1C3|nr:hypothetical protein [Polaribacter sp. Z022]MCL7754667.1 hypothetical protein [Polaribacter sp. Z022]